jgi:hypothetical protein
MSMPKQVGPNMATATPLGPPGPRQRRSSTPGLPELDTQPSAASIRLPGGAVPKVSAPAQGAASSYPGTYAASGPGLGTWKDPDPRRRSSRGSGLRIGLRARGNSGYATPAACSVSTTSWRYGLRRTRRLVAGRSPRPRSAWSDQARLALHAVTHRYKRTPCLWLEQFPCRIRAADGWVSGVRGSSQIGWLWACTSQGR